MPFVKKIHVSIGQTFGKLTVIDGPTKKFLHGKNQYIFKCKCNCGKEVFVAEYALISKNTTTCKSSECRTRKVDRKKIGEKFGLWTVIDGPFSTIHGKSFKVQCDCGTIKNVLYNSLNARTSTSCGCYMAQEAKKRFTIHGKYDTRLYSIWEGIKSRCYRSKHKNYHRYGGRGIIVYDEWKNNPVNFMDWSMNNGYNDNLTLDRIDVNGNYCPENCEWVTKEENSRRQTSKRDEKILFLKQQNLQLQQQINSLQEENNNLKSQLINFKNNQNSVFV